MPLRLCEVPGVYQLSRLMHARTRRYTFMITAVCLPLRECEGPGGLSAPRCIPWRSLTISRVHEDIIRVVNVGTCGDAAASAPLKEARSSRCLAACSWHPLCIAVYKKRHASQTSMG